MILVNIIYGFNFLLNIIGPWKIRYRWNTVSIYRWLPNVVGTRMGVWSWTEIYKGNPNVKTCEFCNSQIWITLIQITFPLDIYIFLYIQVNEAHTNVTATSLISPVAFKTHYCDLMTPFRALELIYIGGVKHGPIEL